MSDDIQYVSWNPNGDAPSSSSSNRNNNNNEFSAFSMLTPRSGAEAMARLAAQAQEEQRLYEQGLLPPRPINETTNNRSSPNSKHQQNNRNQQQSQQRPSANSNNNNNNKKGSVSPAPSHHSTTNTGNSTPRGGNTNNNNKQPHYNYHLNLDKHQRGHPITPVQVLLQVQESLEHACQTADKQGDGINELSGPDLLPDYVPVEGSVGIPKFRTFLEQEESRARDNAANRASSMSAVSAGSIPRGLLGGTQQYGGGRHGRSQYAPSEMIAPDDSVSRIHGRGGHNDHDIDNDGHSMMDENEDDYNNHNGGNKTPRGGHNQQQSPPQQQGHRPLTPRSTVYVTNAVTARFVSERFEASVRDSLCSQEYEHRMDMMRYFYQQHSGIQQRESKSQLREALEQQYLARSEVEELRGAIALRLSDIEEVSRIRLEQIGDDTRLNLEREITRLYGIVAAGQNAAQQQWILGCEERERHFIASEGDRVWSRISGNYLSEGHSLQMRTMLKDRIPVSQSKVVNDALDSVKDSPQAVRSLGQLPAQTASAQINVAPNNYSNNNNDGDQQQQDVQVFQQPLPQIRSLRNSTGRGASTGASRTRTPPTTNTPRQSGGGMMDDEVAPVNADSLIKPKKQMQQQQQERSQTLPSSAAQQNKGGAVEITQLDGPSDDQQLQQYNHQKMQSVKPSNRGLTPTGSNRTGSGGIQGGTMNRAGRSGSGRVGVRGSATAAESSIGTNNNNNAPPAETLAERRKREREEKKRQLDAAKEEKKRQQQELVENRQREIQERQQQNVVSGSRSGANTRSPQRGAGNSTSSHSNQLVDRPLPQVFHTFWGWMFRSLGALLTWQRRFFQFTSNGRLRCSTSEKGPWVLVTTADKIMRVEADFYHDQTGQGLAPPTTQYHQYGFYLDVIDGDPADPSSVRQQRLRFCCFSRSDLTKWMHVFRRATETVDQLAELGVPGTTSPVRRRFDDLAEEATRLGGPHVAEQIHTSASRRRQSPPNIHTPRLQQGNLDEWLSQHQDAEGNPIQAPAVVPYRARVQLEDEVAVLEAREMKEYERQKKAAELESHSDPSLKHPHAHYNTMTTMGKPTGPPDVEQYS